MIYQIIVQGIVDPSWSDWFGGMEISFQTGSEARSLTTLTGHMGDQATLRGILNHLWDLNLIVLSVLQVETAAIMPGSFDDR